MLSTLPWLAAGLASSAAAQTAGSIVEAGDTLVSAMMVRAQDVVLLPNGMLNRVPDVPG